MLPSPSSLQFKPIQAGELELVDASTLDEDLQAAIAQASLSALADCQPEGTCDLLGIPVLGDLPNVRFGVFSASRPSVDALLGAWYVGRIVALPGARFSGRFMPAFSDLDGDKVGKLAHTILTALLSAELATDSIGVKFADLSYAYWNEKRDARDERTLANVAGLVAATAEKASTLSLASSTLDDKGVWIQHSYTVSE